MRVEQRGRVIQRRSWANHNVGGTREQSEAVWYDKRLRRHQRRAVHWLGGIARREPRLFAHWYLLGLRPASWMMGAV